MPDNYAGWSHTAVVGAHIAELRREAVLARLLAHGAELVDEVVQYEDSYRLCYVRGPEGILVGLAQQLS